MKYKLHIINPKFPEYDDPGYFTAFPIYGEILAGMTEDIRVTFSPTEVDEDSTRILLIKIQNLDPEQWCEDPINYDRKISAMYIQLDGEAERPIIHFELT